MPLKKIQVDQLPLWIIMAELAYIAATLKEILEVAG